MKKNKLSRLVAYVLTFCMLMGMFSGLTVTVNADTEPLATEAEGIEFSKTAQLNDNGTADIVMEAYTTGTVTNSESSVPADIVLVLDMSGSMENPASHTSGYIPVEGTRYTYWFSTQYGLQGDYEDHTFYIKEGESYIELEYEDTDRNGFEYYSAGNTNYYPLLSVSASNRRNDYEVKQFYRNMTHMEILKEGAAAFIADTAAKNATIENEADKHRISIVKFATADYYNGSSISGATDDYTQAVIGDNRNSSNYNYTQVVKDLTVVDEDGKTELTNALNNLQAGGATAVDYGLQLAEKVLGDREVSVGRSEAVIVFTDGSPTHSSEYEDEVAGAAIEEALSLKNAGVKIFAIGGADTADSSVLGDDSNKFMHYISNNFPDASYSDEEITEGIGNINGGFYMTPSDDKNLESIFEDIFRQTVALDITMGSTAGVIDSISPFFTIPNGLNSITLQVAEKTASGWGTPTTAVGVTKNINGNTLTVRGFDFDANYVSDSPRQVDGQDFYGKKLIITINATPDYDEIDLHKATFANGAIPTNEGLASVVNSSNETVISVASPTVTARKVTYKVDGEEYAYFYRFPGTSVDVISNPTKEGHDFSGWDRGTFVMPNEDVEINGTFSKNSYKVNYVYSGMVPGMRHHFLSKKQLRTEKRYI